MRLGDRERPETSRVFILPDADRDTDHGRLVDFLARFPHGRYDDPVDATVNAVELAHRVAPRESSDGAGGAPRAGGPRRE